MKKMLRFHSFKYIDKKTFVFYGFINLFSIIIASAMPLVTKLMIDSVIYLNMKKFVYMILAEIISLVLFLSVEAIKDYIHGKLYADNFVKVSKKMLHNSEYFSRKKDKPNFELMLSQNYNIVKPYFFEIQTTLIFSIIKIIITLSIILYYFFWVGIFLIIFIPFGMFLSKIGEAEVNKLSEKNNELNNTVKNLLIDKVKIADEELFLKIKQIGASIISKITDDYIGSKLKFEKNISLMNNFLVYGFLNFLLAAVFIISCIAVIYNKITLGTLEAFQLYTSQLWTPIERIINIRRQYINDKPYIKEFFAALDLSMQELKYEKIEKITLKNYSGISKNNEPLNKPVNFSFNKGNIYLVQGENGAGKSTLLYSLLGLSNRYSGDIYFNNRKIYAGLSILDISFNGASSFISPYGNLAKSSNLSSGQTRYNQIHHALNEDKHLIIIDEPTNYLDSDKKREVLNLIKSKRNSEVIIIIITNDDFVNKFFPAADSLILEKL
ncbi:ATP-binding cassette domain-containing protein [Treponema pedis]|uniref:ATP-binding cassette domain-containing protein n=2 Tax=Treponema pedis TaxID=409322 RepID=A0A7S6WPJ8_9SPIR|nr:ATP-binding cassette domain-containing protein [Treponema pedis]QOW60956.1 ATP-binding cassette domain-containing protein [Treponema pedis]